MTYPINCTRCGHHEASATGGLDWDELRCTACDEFHATRSQWEDSLAPSYTLRTLNLSRTLMLKMSRESIAWREVQS
ncbi:hypothetical protein ACUN9Y_16050 [Halomonas sp. V046]|uniref:hypothetical protein n=1 Tax=Halomonas sp. V046 TaxID=3459611 RepID=UPI004043951A